LPVRDATAEGRQRAYERAARIASHRFLSWSEATQRAYATAVLHAIDADRQLPFGVAEQALLTMFLMDEREALSLTAPLVQVAVAVLRRTDQQVAAASNLAVAVSTYLDPDTLAVPGGP
jgi:hypothetical protein